MRRAILAVVIVLAPQAAAADTDARWLPWLGCWQSATERAVSPDARVCFVPSSTDLVERIAILDPSTAPPSGQPLNADGVDHPIVDPECKGSLILEWSADGHRYYASSDRSCIDEVAARTSGISVLLPGPAWVEVEVAETSGRETVRVRRYRRVSVPASLSERLPAELVARADAAANSLSTMRLTVAQIVDASSRVNSHAIEAMILESNAPFLLTAQGLKTLSKARVDENVIDLMIAVSYPDHFRVDQPQASGAAGSGGYGTMWDVWPAACSSPYFFDPVFCFSSAEYMSSAFFAFERPYYVPPSVIVTPQPPIQPVPNPPAAAARAVNNRGYTRIHESDGPPRPNPSADGSQSSRAHAQRSGSSGGSTPSVSASSSGSSSSGSSSSNSGASSGGGYSSGSGGGDTGRTAVPR